MHLGSQGSVTLTSDGRFLLVTNAGSNDVAVFAVRHDGLELVRTTPSDGVGPVSVTEHDSLVYVLNSGDPGLAGFTLDADGLHMVPGSRRDLAAGADPAQVGFSPDGATVVVTQRGTNSLLSFPVDQSGVLGDPREIASSGQTPVRLHLCRQPNTGGDGGFRRPGREGRRLLLPVDRARTGPGVPVRGQH